MSETRGDLVLASMMRALRLITLTITSLLFGGFVLLFLLTYRDPHDRVAQQAIAFALLAAVGVVAGVAVLRDRPLGRVRWLLVAVVFTASALATTGAPAEHLMAEAEWCYVTVGWFLLLVLIEHSTRAAAVSLGVFTAGSFVQLVAVGQGHQVADLVVVTTIVLGCELPLLALAMGLRRTAATAADAAAREEQARTADAIAERLHADRRSRYAELATSTVPLLRAVAGGSANLGDARVRADYAVAATRLRRLFAEHDEVVDPLLHELRACLDLAGRRGVVAYLGVCGEHPSPPLPVRRALTEPALRAVATAATRARVTVLGTPEGVTVSVVADGAVAEPEPLADEEFGVTVSRLADGAEVWVEATWHVHG